MEVRVQTLQSPLQSLRHIGSVSTFNEDIDIKQLDRGIEQALATATGQLRSEMLSSEERACQWLSAMIHPIVAAAEDRMAHRFIEEQQDLQKEVRELKRDLQHEREQREWQAGLLKASQQVHDRVEAVVQKVEGWCSGTRAELDAANARTTALSSRLEQEVAARACQTATDRVDGQFDFKGYQFDQGLEDMMQAVMMRTEEAIAEERQARERSQQELDCRLDEVMVQVAMELATRAHEEQDRASTAPSGATMLPTSDGCAIPSVSRPSSAAESHWMGQDAPSLGDWVEALYVNNKWYEAIVAEVRPDGSYVLEWADGVLADRVKTLDQLRRPQQQGQQQDPMAGGNLAADSAVSLEVRRQAADHGMEDEGAKRLVAEAQPYRSCGHEDVAVMMGTVRAGDEVVQRVSALVRRMTDDMHRGV